MFNCDNCEVPIHPGHEIHYEGEIMCQDCFDMVQDCMAEELAMEGEREAQEEAYLQDILAELNGCDPCDPT